MAQDLTFSSEYLEIPRHKITIQDVNHRELFVFNPFRPQDNLFTREDFEMTIGTGQTGSFSFTVNDSVNRVIDREELDCGAFIIVDSGRFEDKLVRMISGRVPVIDTDREGANGFTYKFNGVGRESELANILMNVKFSALIDPLSSKFVMQEQFKAKNVIKDIFTNPNYMIPSSKKSDAINITLQDVTGFTLNGISNDLIDPLFELDFNQTSASQILSSIEDQLNIDIFVDQQGDVVAKYPTDLHSGMTIKTVEESGDDARFTGYVEGKHSFTDSIASSDYISHLTGVGRLTASNEGSTDMSGFLSLYNKDIGQQIPTSALRFENLVIILQRVGAGTNANNPVTFRVNGAIIEDDFEYPGKKVIGRFFIPITKIPENPTMFNISEYITTDAVANPSKKYWIMLYEVGSNEENTIRWYHDNSIGREVKTYPNAIRPLPSGRSSSTGVDRFSTEGWRVGWTGPTFSYIFQSKESHEITMKNINAVKRWGRKDARISNLRQGINDSGSVISSMDSVLRNSATKTRTYSFDDVIIPLDFFMPGYIVNFIDPPIGLTRQSNYTLTIQEVRYRENASNDPKGSNVCSITAVKKLRPTERYLKTRIEPV